MPSPGPPEPVGFGQGGTSPNTLHIKPALSKKNFIPENVLASYLLGVLGLTGKENLAIRPYFKIQRYIKNKLMP